MYLLFLSERVREREREREVGGLPVGFWWLIHAYFCRLDGAHWLS